MSYWITLRLRTPPPPRVLVHLTSCLLSRTLWHVFICCLFSALYNSELGSGPLAHVREGRSGEAPTKASTPSDGTWRVGAEPAGTCWYNSPWAGGVIHLTPREHLGHTTLLAMRKMLDSRISLEEFRDLWKYKAIYKPIMHNQMHYTMIHSNIGRDTLTPTTSLTNPQ